MKKRYEAPKINVEYYAQFENVFTKCTKGNETKTNCDIVPGWPPKGSEYAAFGGQNTSR